LGVTRGKFQTRKGKVGKPQSNTLGTKYGEKYFSDGRMKKHGKASDPARDVKRRKRQNIPKPRSHGRKKSFKKGSSELKKKHVTKTLQSDRQGGGDVGFRRRKRTGTLQLKKEKERQHRGREKVTCNQHKKGHGAEVWLPWTEPGKVGGNTPNHQIRSRKAANGKPGPLLGRNQRGSIPHRVVGNCWE